MTIQITRNGNHITITKVDFHSFPNGRGYYTRKQFHIIDGFVLAIEPGLKEEKMDGEIYRNRVVGVYEAIDLLAAAIIAKRLTPEEVGIELSDPLPRIHKYPLDNFCGHPVLHPYGKDDAGRTWQYNLADISAYIQANQ